MNLGSDHGVLMLGVDALAEKIADDIAKGGASNPPTPQIATS